MSFSTNDIQMGADLVIKAIGEDVQGFLKDPNPEPARQSSAADNNRAKETLRALSRWQLENQILVMNQGDRTYSIDPEAISKLDDQQIQSGGGLYNAAVTAHLPIAGDLHRAGKEDYVRYFSENHRNVDGLIEPPISRPTENSMDTVAKAALGFLQAVDTDPSKGASVAGVTRMDVEALTTTLADAGYLVPGENPDRVAPLSQQGDRGSYEQKLAIFETASAIAANIEVADSMKGFDGPMLAARGLKTSVDEAQIEEIPVFGSGKIHGAHVDSDLHKDDVKAITMTMLLAAKIVQNSQMSTDIEDHDTDMPMVVMGQRFTTIDAEGNTADRNDLLATFREHVAHDIDAGIVDVLKRGADSRTAHDLYIPDLASNARDTRDAAQTLSGFYKAAIKLAQFEPNEDERIDGDAGARGLGGPHSQWETGDDSADGASAMGEFDREVDLDEAEAEGGHDAPALGSNQKAELETERFARTQKIELDSLEIKAPEEVIEAMATKIDEANMRGLLAKMAAMTGREAVHGERDAAIFAGNRAASFGGYEDFMQSSQVEEASEKDFARDVYSFGQVERRGADFDERLTKQGAVRIDTERGFLKNSAYRPGSAASAPRRVANFIRENMVDQNDKPNFALRSVLRKVADRPVVARSQEEAQSWKRQGQNFVERENQEHKLRLEAASEKAGVWGVDISRVALQRAIDVTVASGDEHTPFHVKIGKSGISMVREDAPRIDAPMNDKVPESIRNANAGRDLGGMIAPAAIRGALEAMNKDEKQAHLVFHGEVPRGVTSQIVQDRQRAAELAKANKPKGLEPHLPDMLG